MKSQSLERGLDVMELLNASQEPLGPREISRQLGLEGVRHFMSDLVSWRNEKSQALPNGCIG
ncbi:helix-turn-helix domain-containing protein [Paraburkholderia youngii]